MSRPPPSSPSTQLTPGWCTSTRCCDRGDSRCSPRPALCSTAKRDSRCPEGCEGRSAGGEHGSNRASGVIGTTESSGVPPRASVRTTQFSTVASSSRRAATSRGSAAASVSQSTGGKGASTLAGETGPSVIRRSSSTKYGPGCSMRVAPQLDSRTTAARRPSAPTGPAGSAGPAGPIGFQVPS